ncbi:ATP-binding cassette domain-containing protein [Mycobacterium heidelbergense]|uniref:ABC transporter ATP-binding protein/permease n=1 Tax=Mycobacterium heidelbergense TaxID=53376 RepID=UPI003CEA48D0
MGTAIELLGVSVRVADEIVALRDITLAVESGELVAIVGASGTGKTTLLNTMSGMRVPTAGQVRSVCGTVGYVPQDDIVHLTLPLERSLQYTAALRGVNGDSVESAISVLELEDRAAVPIGRLSGGQRKRASIAAELLAGPDAFFLDEPTSGLDPARGAELMRSLRGLAGGGATIVLTTHNPHDAERCDKVAVLAEGGRLAFFGTPEQARAHFGVATLADVYELLTEAPRPAFSPRASVNSRDVVPPGGFRQWLLLARRDADILRRDRLTLAILVGSPLMVLAMFLVLFEPNAFDPAQPNPEAMVMIVFWLAFGGFFFGLTYGLLQICTEIGVLRRERFTGLKAAPYVLAKVTILLPVLAGVDFVFLVVLRALGRLPASGDYGSVFVTLLLSSAAALGFGLMISVAVAAPAQATIALPMVCFPQVLFVGAILPVPAMAEVGRWISYAMTNRWAFEALGHSLGVTSLWASGASPLGPPLLASYGETFSRPVAADWLILAGFSVSFLAATAVIVARRAPARPKPLAVQPG